MMPANLANNLQDQQQFLDLLSFVFEIAAGGDDRLNQLRPAMPAE